MPALDRVRLLILGGEAAPPELVARLVTADREVGTPTARPRPRSSPAGPGWSPASRCGSGCRWPAGTWPSSTGPASQCPPVRSVSSSSAGRPGPLPRPGQGCRGVRPDPPHWAGTGPTRSGDLVRFDGAGLLFQGRADDQVKVGGRRIELGGDRLRPPRPSPGWRAPQPRCGGPRPATPSWSGMSPWPRRHPATASTPRLLPSTFARRCRRRSSHVWPS